MERVEIGNDSRTDLSVSITANVELDEQPVEIGLKAPFQQTAWFDAEWVGDAGTTREARIWVGPADDDDVLAPSIGVLAGGVYTVRYRVHDDPAIPAEDAFYLYVIDEGGDPTVLLPGLLSARVAALEAAPSVHDEPFDPDLTPDLAYGLWGCVDVTGDFTVHEPTGTPRDGQPFEIRLFVSSGPVNVTWDPVYNDAATLPALPVSIDDGGWRYVRLRYNAVAVAWHPV